jgi:DNA-binding winged helix-turn-helix (wHTH) protein
VLDVDQRELRRDGVPVPMEPQAFDVLAYLVRHRDRVVPKEELMDEVWGGRFVTETAVTSRIKQVRRALGDDGRAQGFVRTHHGRGYRFVAEGRELGGGAPPSPGSADLPVLAATTADGRQRSYHLAGQGPPDIVLLDGRELDAWEDPARGALLRGIAALGRLVRVEPGTSLPDLVTVLDDAACDRAVLVGDGTGAALAVRAAATYPERFRSLVLWAADVGDAGLEQLGQPTLVLHATGDPEVPVERARRLAARIPGAELRELAGDAHAPEDQSGEVLDALGEVVEEAALAEAPDQSLTALVGLAGPDTAALASVLVSLGGRARRGPERALVVSFDGPATAVRALGSRRARGFLASVGVGIAIAEVSRSSELVSGHGVDVARLLALRAEPGEVLVPNVIKDLLAGSGLHVESVGSFDLPHVGPHPAYRWVR